MATTETQYPTRDEAWRVELRKKLTPKQRMALPRISMPTLDPDYRITCNEEVSMGITAEQAMIEAQRCLDCNNPDCVNGCPVGVQIPLFIKHIERGEFDQAADALKLTSSLPAVCGRVCPQEKQCESRCIHTKTKHESVAIGYLERFAADWQRNNMPNKPLPEIRKNGIKIAVVGSGPAGLTFAGEMAKLGYSVTVFEALHEIGGVLKYGIPEFRLPNEIVDHEIQGLKRMGVEFVKNFVVSMTESYEELKAQGYKGLFVGSGAGFPRFMNIPGENLPGVMSANEYLTRINLMHAGTTGDTPVAAGKRIAIIGGGNTAMDAARTARRTGAQVALVYRRTEAEMPARLEEIHHAKEEGITIMELSNPVEYLPDENGHVRAMRIQRMQLGEPDESGRRKPVPIPGRIDEVPIDVVIVAVGVQPNSLVPRSIQGLEVSRRSTIVVNEDTMQSTVPDVYAGGDIVRGGATVILAMGDGRRAAHAMHHRLSNVSEQA